jgi:hypothetical protein
MKIGKLEFKDYAAKKPLGVGPEGKFLTAADLAGKATLSLGSMHRVKPALQKQLTLERYKLEPEFKLGRVAHGVLTKAEIMDNIENDTEFGQLAVRVEMGYCNELIAALGAGGGPVVWPKQVVIPIKPGPDWRPVKRCILLRLQTRALFCENTTDSVTAPIAAYHIANVHPVFAARGFAVVALTGVNDVRANFVPQAKNQATGYIGGVGHGNVNIYTGYQNSMTLQVGAYDPAEVSGKGLHFLSCLTGAQLAQDTVNHGAKFYAGYTEEFTFVWDNPGTPVNEFLLFVQADSTFDIWIANGNTAQQALNATIQAFNAAIAQVPGSTAASWLTYDRDHLVLRGNGAATVLPATYVRFCYPLPLAQQEAIALAGSPVE